MRPRAQITAALAALVATGIAAGPAEAGGTLTPVPGHLVATVQQLAGPAFAGSGLAWATPAPGGGYTVTVMNAGGVRKQHVFAAGNSGDEIREALSASADQVAFAVSVSRCADESACKYMQYEQVESSVYAGPIGEPLALRGCAGPVEIEQSVDVEGTVLAAFDSCSGGAKVRDLAAPSDVPWRVYPSAGQVRIAGHYVATSLHVGGYDADHTTVAVYDLRSGDQVYRLDPPTGPVGVDIQDDGTLVLERPVQGSGGGPSRYELYSATPAQPTPHPVASIDNAGKVRLVSGRIAVRDGDTFRVFDLAGNQLAATPASDAIGDFDFDGSRLAFGLQPCEVAAIATWDLDGQAPALPPGRCPRARLTRHTAVADLSRRTIRLEVRCPAQPALGCSGDWYARFPNEGAYTYEVALAPGEGRTLKFRLFKRTACRLARNASERATVHLGPDGTRRPAAAGRYQRVRVRVTGKPRGCRP